MVGEETIDSGNVFLNKLHLCNIIQGTTVPSSFCVKLNEKKSKITLEERPNNDVFLDQYERLLK